MTSSCLCKRTGRITSNLSTTPPAALVGQGKKQNAGQMWPKQWGKNDLVRVDFFDLISMKGGEFF